MENVVAQDPAVEHVGRLTGIDSNGLSPTPPNAGLLRVRLRPPGARESYDIVSDRLRDRLASAVPSSLFDFHQILEDLINDLSGTPAPIDIAIAGSDQQTLIALAQRITSAIGTVHGVVDAASGVTYDSPSLRIAPRGSALAALGLSAADLGDAVTSLEQGTVATSLPGANALIPVRVLVGDGAATVDRNTMLYAKGATTALGDVASLSTRRLSSDITTQNGRLQMHVTANFEGVSLSAATAGIRAALRNVAMPPGYVATIGGQAQSQAASFGEFVSVIAIAVALVFAVMLATFRSFRLPLVILTAIPLALIGVALALFLTGTHVNVSSFMGLLLLVGIVVKNGILLIDVANRARAGGASVEESLVIAGRTRLRPIVMTTLAAIGGLFPLALGIGQGAEMEKPLAIAVIGGLSTATIFTLIVIPVLYATFAGRSRVPVRAVMATALVLGVAIAGVPRAAPAQGMPAVQPLLFAQLSLADAERKARAASPDVAQARARLDQSQAALLSARSGLAPSLVAAYVQTPQGNPPGPNVISRQGSAGVQWTIGDFLAFGPAVREAALTQAASVADEHAAEAAENIKVIGLYYDALKARAVLDARTNALALAHAQRDGAAVRTHAGDAPRLDVIRADVAVARAQADAELAAATDENATEALRVETGVAKAVLDSTAPGAFAVVNARLLDPAVTSDLARRLRPEVISARLTAQASAAAVGVARAGGFPIVTVGGGYVTGTDSGVPINAPQVNANMTIPLGPAARGHVGEAAARAAEAQAKADAVERQIVLDAAASARTLGASQRAADAMTRARAAADAELRATEIGYRNGASSSLEVTSARSTYAQAVVDELSAMYDLQKARAILDVETGR